METITIAVDEGLRGDIRALSRATGVSVSETCRQALREYVRYAETSLTRKRMSLFEAHRREESGRPLLFYTEGPEITSQEEEQMSEGPNLPADSESPFAAEQEPAGYEVEGTDGARVDVCAEWQEAILAGGSEVCPTCRHPAREHSRATSPNLDAFS